MNRKKAVAVTMLMSMTMQTVPFGMTAGAAEVPVLTVAIPQNSNVENYDTNYQTLLIEEALGVDLQFQLMPTSLDDARSKLALMASSGEQMPDVICMSLTNMDVSEYGASGIFLPMNDYLSNAEITPNFNAIEEEDRAAIRESVTSPDGNIYTLAAYRPEDWNLTPYRCWINTTWLDTLGLEIPTTTEEFKAVCEAFATQDPNGNGINDEIAITGASPSAAWGCFTPYFLMNAFTFYNANMSNNGLSLDEDGKTVVAPYVSEEWKAGLEYMNELCAEGYLDPAMFTMDGTQFTGVLDQNPNMVGCVCAGGWGYWTGGLDSENFPDFTLLNPLTGPDGNAYAATFEYTPTYYWNITKDCTNPELAMKVGDFFYRKDVSYTSRYGEEGTDWSTDEAETAQKKGLYEDLLGIKCSLAVKNDQWSKIQNKHWYAECPHFISIEEYRGLDSMQNGDDNRNAVRRAASYQAYYGKHPELMPTLKFTPDETEQISAIAADVNTYVSSSMAEFITGNRPISDWDNYVTELENMGLNQLIDISQIAYDRTLAE